MSCRRDFLKDLMAVGALQGVITPPATARSINAFLNDTAQELDLGSDAESNNFWSTFLEKVVNPIEPGGIRGPRGPENNDLQPIFLHYASQGFKNATEIPASELISEGDVNVALNTSTIKISRQDQETFNHLQNAQVRVDVAQKTAILPVIEAMGYTVVSGMLSLKGSGGSKGGGTTGGGSKGAAQGGQKPSGSGNKGHSGSVQSISVEPDATWQKMQNIILPGGEGRWALNLEAQKKDSLMYKLLQHVVKEAGLFAPMIGLPGIAMSALQSFNILYGAMHAQPVPIIKSSPIRVFATQEAFQRTGAPGAATGIMLKSGTYVLIPANRAPDPGELKDLAVMQGRIVPPKTQASQLDAAAADTLPDITYVTFDVEVRPTRLFPGAEQRKSG